MFSKRKKTNISVFKSNAVKFQHKVSKTRHIWNHYFLNEAVMNQVAQYFWILGWKHSKNNFLKKIVHQKKTFLVHFLVKFWNNHTSREHFQHVRLFRRSFPNLLDSESKKVPQNQFLSSLMSSSNVVLPCIFFTSIFSLTPWTNTLYEFIVLLTKALKFSMTVPVPFLKGTLTFDPFVASHFSPDSISWCAVTSCY